MTSLKKAIYAILLCCIAIMLYSAAEAKSKKSDWDKAATLRKADYAYVQACIANAMDSIELAYHLLDYSRELNPEDVEIATMHGLISLPVSVDSASQEAVYRLALKRYLDNPDDYPNGYTATLLARSLGHFDDLVMIWEKLDSVFPTDQDIAPRLASAYMMKYILGDTACFDKAMNIYDRIERGSGKDLGITSYKIRAYQTKKDTASIVREIASILHEMPMESDAWLFAAQVYNAVALDSAKVIEYLTRARELDPSNGQASMAIAEFYEQHGDSVAQTRELRNALLSSSLDVDSKCNLLRSYFVSRINDSTQYDDMRQLLDTLTLINPGESKIHANYGAFLYTIEDSTAFEQFNYALSLDPTDSNLRNIILMNTLNKGDTASAITIASEGRVMDPDNLYYPIMSASLLSQQGHKANAMAIIDSTDVSEVNNPQAVASFLTTAGDIYSSCDSIDRAIQFYERAIAIDPNQPMAYNNASYMLAEKGRDLEKALRYARYAVLSEVDNPTYLDTYAWVYFKLKNYPEAKSYIDKALKFINRYPVDSISDTETDSIAHEITEVAENTPADSCATEISVTDAETAPVTEIQIVEDDDSENIPEAVEEEAPYLGSAEVLEHAGDIYFMSGFPEQALKFWEQALELNPDKELLQRKVKNKTFYYK